MATLNIRNIDNALIAQLRARAALHGRSMEEEARSILCSALAEGPELRTGAVLAKAINARARGLGGIELELRARAPKRQPPGS